MTIGILTVQGTTFQDVAHVADNIRAYAEEKKITVRQTKIANARTMPKELDVLFVVLDPSDSVVAHQLPHFQNLFAEGTHIGLPVAVVQTGLEKMSAFAGAKLFSESVGEAHALAPLHLARRTIGEPLTAGEQTTLTVWCETVLAQSGFRA